MYLNSPKPETKVYAEVQCNPGSEILSRISQVTKGLEISLSPFLSFWI